MALLTGWASFIVGALVLMSIYSLLTLGLNLHYGYAGLINFGHVAFFAAGAYAVAILTVPPPGEVLVAGQYMYGFNLPMPWGFPVSLLAGALVGGILAVLVGLTSVRLGSHYLAIATFALAGVFKDVILNEAWLTNGPYGFNNVPRPGHEMVSPDLWHLAYLAFAILMVFVVYRLVEQLANGPTGRLWKGIREDETAARMLGKDTNSIKITAFGLGGAIAGLSGGIYAHYVGAVLPAQFIPEITFIIWMSMIIGGVASNKGAIVGTVLIVAFREFTRFITVVYSWVLSITPDFIDSILRGFFGTLPGHSSFIPSVRFMIIGLLLIVVIRYRPEGILGDETEITALGEKF